MVEVNYYSGGISTISIITTLTQMHSILLLHFTNIYIIMYQQQNIDASSQKYLAFERMDLFYVINNLNKWIFYASRIFWTSWSKIWILKYPKKSVKHPARINRRILFKTLKIKIFRVFVFSRRTCRKCL